MTVSELVGRAAELAELEALIGRGRLVTVTGPGGVGKTSWASVIRLNTALRLTLHWR